jgi:hypothetical protein
LGVVIFLLALLPRIIHLNVFVGPDEFSWVLRSANFAQALATGELGETYQTGHPGVTVMWVGTFEIWGRYLLQSITDASDWQAVINAPKTIELLGNKRTFAGVVNSLLLTGFVLLVSKTFGMPVAWITGFLLAFDPFLLSESRAFRTEGFVTAFSAVALGTILLYEYQPRLSNILMAGIWTGLALLSKISAVALLPVGVLAVTLPHLLAGVDSSTKRWRPAMKSLLIWSVVIVLTIVLLWPVLWFTPLSVFERMFNYTFVRVAEDGGATSQTFFLGEALPDNSDPGLLFYPVVLIFRTSPVIMIGLVLLILSIPWATRTIPHIQLFMLGLTFLFLILYLAVISRAQIKYDRYIIPMIPALSLVAALGFQTGWGFLSHRWRMPSWLARFGWLAAVAILLAQMALALPHHPYYYTYWNPLVGGIRQAVRVLPVGTGNEGIDQVAAYLNTLPDSENIKLASANSQRIRPVFNGQTIALGNLDGKWVQADRVMIYISQVQRGKHAEDILQYLARHKPEHTISLRGLEYAWIYPGPEAQFYGGGHKLEGRGTLFGYNVCAGTFYCQKSEPVEATAGETLYVTAFWRNEGQQPEDRFFVRIMDIDGYVWAEAIFEPRSGFEEANRQANSIVESEAVIELPVGMPPGDYFIKPGFRTSTGEIIGYFELPAATKPIRISTASKYPQLGAYQAPLSTPQPFSDELYLLGFDLQPESPTPGQPFWLTLFWQATTDVNHDYVVLLRLLADEGSEVAYWLGRPVRSGYPTQEWQRGQIVQDPWRLDIPPDISPERYQLEIALFDAKTEAEKARILLGPITLQPTFD